MSNKNLLITYYEQINDFANKISGRYIEYDTQLIYEKGKRIQNISESMPTDEIEIRCYTAKTIFKFDNFRMIFSFEGKSCSLSFGIIFNNDEESMEYSFFELSNVFEKDDFKSYNNGYLYNDDKLKLAFSWLYIGIENHFDEICRIAKDQSKIIELNKNLEHDIAVLKKRSVYDQIVLNSSFELFLKNEYIKSIKKYEKLNSNLTKFEIRLLSFMKNQIAKGNEKEYFAVPQEINALRLDVDTNKKNIFELLSFYVCFPVCAVLGTLPFLAAYFIFRLFISDLSIVPPFEMVFVPGIFFGIILVSYTYKFVLKLFLKGKYEEYMEVSKIKSGKADSIVLRVLRIIVTATCVIFMVICFRWNIIFKDDGFIDNSKFLIPTSEFVSYQNVEGLYKIKAFRNALGGIYKEPAYAIKLKDGRVISLRAIGDPNEKTINFLTQKIGKIKEAEFIEDINN